jgi:hypothetical protein
MTSMTKYRGTAGRGLVIALSIAFEHDDLLSRGLGLDHLREMLIRLARPLLRAEASIAYGGHWKESDDNFTYDLLRLISAEQQDSDGEDGPSIGRLINLLPWPHYFSVTPRIEAQWIRCCRIIRVTQQLAGMAEAAQIPEAAARTNSDGVTLNSAIVLSAMRRLTMTGIATRGTQSTDIVSAAARVLLGGKTQGFSGFVPGLFEEALSTLQTNRPLYILGGFGGAAGVLGRALLAPPGTARPPEFDPVWLEANNPKLKRLLTLVTPGQLPPHTMATIEVLTELWAKIEAARMNLTQGLNTGLDTSQTRELLETRDMKRAVELVVRGLESTIGLERRPS